MMRSYYQYCVSPNMVQLEGEKLTVWVEDDSGKITSNDLVFDRENRRLEFRTQGRSLLLSETPEDIRFEEVFESDEPGHAVTTYKFLVIPRAGAEPTRILYSCVTKQGHIPIDEQPYDLYKLQKKFFEGADVTAYLPQGIFKMVWELLWDVFSLFGLKRPGASEVSKLDPKRLIRDIEELSADLQNFSPDMFEIAEGAEQNPVLSALMLKRIELRQDRFYNRLEKEESLLEAVDLLEKGRAELKKILARTK